MINIVLGHESIEGALLSPRVCALWHFLSCPRELRNKIEALEKRLLEGAENDEHSCLPASASLWAMEKSWEL